LKPLNRTSSSHRNRKLSAKTSSTLPARIETFVLAW